MRGLPTKGSLVFGGAALLVLGVVALIPFGQSAKWVGHTDLQVRFVVSDATTEQPVPQAIVHIRAEAGGLCDDGGERKFTITTDENGHATHLCKGCMCFGSKSIFEDTFAVHLPHWWFHATAAGYSGTDPRFLDASKNAPQVQRSKGLATITVPIRLRKA